MKARYLAPAVLGIIAIALGVGVSLWEGTKTVKVDNPVALSGPDARHQPLRTMPIMAIDLNAIAAAGGCQERFVANEPLGPALQRLEFCLLRHRHLLEDALLKALKGKRASSGRRVGPEAEWYRHLHREGLVPMTQGVKP